MCFWRGLRGVGRGPLACFIFAPALRVFSRPEGYDAFTLEISHSKGLAVAVAACGASVSRVRRVESLFSVSHVSVSRLCCEMTSLRERAASA